MNATGNTDNGGLILVVGATGTQGGAVAHELLAHGHCVRALTRHPDGQTARRLAEQGAEVARGDMDDGELLDAALQGVTGVFSVQQVDMAGSDGESRQGLMLVQAAQRAGVQHFVHTSVAGVEKFPRWDKDPWMVHYQDEKWAIEEYVRNAGFTAWTVLRPAWMMDNFAEPAARFMFPRLCEYGEIFTALKPDTRLSMVASDDVGSFTRAAFEDPIRFNGQNISLAAQALTLGEAAVILSRVLDKRVISLSLSPEETIARGLYPNQVKSHDYLNERGQPIDIEALKQYGIPLTSFELWAQRHRDRIIVD